MLKELFDGQRDSTHRFAQSLPGCVCGRPGRDRIADPRLRCKGLRTVTTFDTDFAAAPAFERSLPWPACGRGNDYEVWNDLGPLAGGYASNGLIRRGHPIIFSRKVMMTVATVFVATGALFNSATGTVAVLASLSVSTFGVGVWAGNLHTLPNDSFPKHIVATVYGSAGAAGGILFNTLVGYWSSQGDYWAVFTLWAILEPLGFIGLWLWLRDEPTPQEAA